MSNYCLTVAGNNTTTGAQRTFNLTVSADTADEARRSIGNRPAVDATDNAWFDEWCITNTRRA